MSQGLRWRVQSMVLDESSGGNQLGLECITKDINRISYRFFIKALHISISGLGIIKMLQPTNLEWGAGYLYLSWSQSSSERKHPKSHPKFISKLFESFCAGRRRWWCHAGYIAQKEQDKRIIGRPQWNILVYLSFFESTMENTYAYCAAV